MGNKRTKMSMKNQIVFALREIKDKYTKILPSDIEMFAPIYYPIAILEMNLDEMTFEDFEAVQMIVLKLIGLGQVDDEVVSDLLGLSPNYIYKIKHLLRGYGHVSDDRITDLGKRSLKEGKKIIMSQVWQQFQVDALNGILIKMDKLVSENMLNSKEQTHIMVGHLDYLDGITTETIEDQLQNQNYSDFIRQKTGVLNTNVLAINDVKCVEVRYAQCFLMKLKNVNEPIVFSKRYDEEKREIRERFSWQPFSIGSEMIRERFDFESEIPIESDLARQYINNVYNMIMERAEKVNLEEDKRRALKNIYPFADGGISLGGYSANNTLIVNIDENALKRYTSWLPYFMLDLAQHGEHLITSEFLFGKIISLRSNSNRLLKVCELLNEKVKSEDKSKVFNALKNSLRDIQGDKLLIDEIESIWYREEQE